MIHKFTIHGTNLVLDVNSGSLHMLDDAAFACVGETSLINPHPELEQLIQDGTLYSSDTYSDIALEKLRQSVPVKALCLHVAHDCNLRCKYCFADEGEYHGKRELMSLDTAKKSIDFVISHSHNRRNIEVDFFGGEPLMNFDVVKQTVEYARAKEEEAGKHFRFTLTTNGLLLNDSHIQYINQHMDNVVISLDGRPETNDNMRKTANGGGSYHAIVDNLIKLAKSRDELQKDCYIRGTFTCHNLDFTNDIRHLASLGFKNISIEPVTSDEETAYALTESHLPAISQEYERFAKKYVHADYSFFHFIANDGGPCAIKRLSGCGAGCEYVAIAPNGDIYPCHQYVGNPNHLMGNVLVNTFDTAISNQFSQINVYSKEKCHNCWAKFYCSGGCHANQTHLACELMKKRTECALYVLAMRSL